MLHSTCAAFIVNPLKCFGHGGRKCHNNSPCIDQFEAAGKTFSLKQWGRGRCHCMAEYHECRRNIYNFLINCIAHLYMHAVAMPTQFSEDDISWLGSVARMPEALQECVGLEFQYGLGSFSCVATYFQAVKLASFMEYSDACLRQPCTCGPAITDHYSIYLRDMVVQ